MGVAAGRSLVFLFCFRAEKMTGGRSKRLSVNQSEEEVEDYT